MIKPIETVYNGYRFRSRLEARWAVFFDVLGIEYEYESEGYDLGECGWYLPDFYLPELSCFIEVKGKAPGLESIQNKKCRALAVGTGKPVYMVFNCRPFETVFDGVGMGTVSKFYGSYNYFLPDGDWDGCWNIGYCQQCKNYSFGLFGEWCGICGSRMDPLGGRLMKAYIKARQARFEFGECG